MNNFENENNYFSFVPIYNFFIEQYMVKANPSFIIIYIYILKKTINRENIYLDKLAEKLNILASDIIKALNYWKDEKLICYTQIENKLEVVFFNTKREISQIQIKQEKPKIELNNNFINTDDEITIYSQKEDIQQLFRLAEKKLAKTLSYQDRKILITLYENYGISLEVLAFLFTYCLENGKNNLNYIEKVAIDWSENNIDSIEKIEAYLNIYDKNFKIIMSYFGIINRQAIKKEQDIMKTWLIDYEMPLEIIKEACERTILQTSKANFEYANSIIKNWKDKNVKSLNDIKKLDVEHKDYNKAKAEERQKNIEQKYNVNNFKNKFNKNRFLTYNEKPLDYELLRKIEIRSLNEGIEDDD